jgi:hypothetical protein
MGGRRAGKCARRESVLTRPLAKERQGLGSTARAQPCGCRRQTEARRRTSNKGMTQLQGKGARAAMTAAAPAKRPARLDGRLSGDGGSARRRGAGQRSKNGTDESTGLALFSLRGTKAKLHSEEGNVVLTSGPRMRWQGGVEALGEDGCRSGDGGELVGAEEAEVGLAPSFHGQLRLQGERQLRHPSRSTHGTPSLGGLACRPDGDVGVQRCGDFGFSHGRPPVLLSPSFSFSPSPPLFLWRTGRNPQAAADFGR